MSYTHVAPDQQVNCSEDCSELVQRLDPRGSAGSPLPANAWSRPLVHSED